MGTAPGNSRHPAMPDPERLVTRSVAVLKTMGCDDHSALIMIDILAITAAQSITEQYGTDITWLGVVSLVARSRAAALTPSHRQRSENEHADGSSSRSGGQETAQA